MNERAVEGDARRPAVAARRLHGLRTDAVHRDHERPVGDPVAHDDLLPERLGVEVGMGGLRSDGGRIYEHLGSRERVRTRKFGEPLVPARREAELCLRELRHRERVFRCRALSEVPVLEVALGDRYVELAGARDELSVGGRDDRGVEAQSVVGVGALVERCVDVNARFARQLRGEGARRAGRELLRHGPDRGRSVRLDREVRGERQFLEADEACPLLHGDADALGQRLPMLLRVCVPPVLHRADAYRLPRRVPDPRRRPRCRSDRGDQAERAHARESTGGLRACGREPVG